MTRKDFTQTAFDVMRQATGQAPREPAPAPAPKRLKIAKSEPGQRVSPETLEYVRQQTAPKMPKGAAKESAKKGR